MNGDLGERAQISIMFKEMLEKECIRLKAQLDDYCLIFGKEEI